MVLQAGVLMSADTMQDRVKAVARLQSLINAYSGAVFIKQRASIRFNIVEFFLAHDAALQERIDELEKDAARYRHMRDQNSPLEQQNYLTEISSGVSCYHIVGGVRELKSGDALDKSIDAAMTAEVRK